MSVCFILGMLLAVAGGNILMLAASGTIVQAQVGAYVVGATIFAVAIPSLMAPFFARSAEVIAFVVFAGFSAAILWAAFGSDAATPSVAFQIAAVLFGLLLLFHLGLTLRKRKCWLTIRTFLGAATISSHVPWRPPLQRIVGRQ